MLTGLIAFFQSVLYAISVCLLAPVMIVLTLLLVWIVIELGAFCAEFFRRSSFDFYRKIDEYLPATRKKRAMPEVLLKKVPFRLREYFDELLIILGSDSHEMLDERIEVLIQQREIEFHKKIEKSYLLVRIGPALGLMGTLIPMGQGLASLSQGNMAEMSSSLIIAFTTTVAGLAVGILAFMISTIRARWIKEDILIMELLTDAIAGNMKETDKQS